METVIIITREGDDFSEDIKVAVSVEIDGYGVRPSRYGYTNDTIYQLTKAEMDRAADQAWEEAHEE